MSEQTAATRAVMRPRRDGAGEGRFSLAELRFILARVRAEMAATPPAGPLLEEPKEPRARKTACSRGHVDAGRTRSRQCRACERERKRRDRRGAS